MKFSPKHMLSLALVLALILTILPTAGNAESRPNADTRAGCTANCHTNNAAFLNADWFNGNIALSDQQIADYVNKLKQYKIKYQFVDVGVLIDSNTASNGSLPAAGYSKLANWIKVSRQTDPNQLIIPALNYGSRAPRVNGVKTPNPNFGTQTFKANLNAAANKLVNTGLQINGSGTFYKADGIHLDIEGFISNDTVLLGTLQYLRDNALASNTNFSQSTPADFGSSPVWSNAFIAQVGAILNQVQPMIYDQMGWGSPIVDAASYQALWTQEVKRYSTALDGTSSKLMPTMPAYEKKTAEDGTVYHDPAVESLYNAAKGLQAAIASPGGANVHGASIFWWSHFAGYHPTVYAPALYQADQSNWLNEWVNHP
ncbi:hypothetical protein [Paenibacillus sp. FJAT-26967]|uniref:hypothetical protein n=1 Tax=Paenibacillus sp. FJAT-26967 TaxID=1729690 RepID=UPI00083892DA|nr:hypothetical protein [Paenibacillus sp. FJAT-26967]